MKTTENNLIKKIIYYASLSPSAHNTQPWKFKVTDNNIEFYLDKSRALGYSDPKKWETYLSLGACLENIISASRALGILGEVTILPNGENDSLIARIKISDSVGKTDKNILEVIKLRQTNRSNYLNKQVSPDLIEKWKVLVGKSSINVTMITDSNIIKQIADMQYEATLMAFSDKKFREELSRWVRHNLTKAHDGMPGYATNIPLPMSFLGPWMVRNINIGKMQGEMEKKWVLSAPLIMIFGIKSDSKKSLIEAGSIFEQIALDITASGLVYAPLGAVIEMPQVNGELRKLLGTSENLVMLVRIGYSDKKYKFSPKRTVDEVLIS